MNTHTACRDATLEPPHSTEFMESLAQGSQRQSAQGRGRHLPGQRQELSLCISLRRWVGADSGESGFAPLTKEEGAGGMGGSGDNRASQLGAELKSGFMGPDTHLRWGICQGSQSLRNWAPAVAAGDRGGWATS